jgi:hypothetical protein
MPHRSSDAALLLWCFHSVSVSRITACHPERPCGTLSGAKGTKGESKDPEDVRRIIPTAGISTRNPAMLNLENYFVFIREISRPLCFTS